MKQHITSKQLNELSDKGKERLREWCEDKKYGKEKIEELKWQGGDIRHWKIPLLSIGQMIEFLDEKGEYLLLDLNKDHLWCNATNHTTIHSGIGNINIFDIELCDALWEAVKEVLK